MSIRVFFSPLIIFVLLIASCSNGGKELSFDKDYYEVPLRRETQITFVGQANNVKCSDTTVVSVNIKDNYIKVAPKRKGIASITVEGESLATMRIRVVDAYACFTAGSPAYEPFDRDVKLYLIGNENKDFYVYDERNTLLSSGIYDTSIVNNGFRLTLHSDDDTDGEYDITGSSDVVLRGTFPNWLGVNWGIDFATGRTRSPSPSILKLINVKTDVIYYFVLRESYTMPYHVLTE